MVNKPYTCPRCGYKSNNRSDMRKHFYLKKKLCPAQDNDIDLDDDVKEYVLNNRLYILPKQSTTNTIINNYNNINNFIAGMDAIEKLEKYTKHMNIELIGFEQSIEDKYSRSAKRLENGSIKYGYELDKDDLLDIIDQVSKVNFKDQVKTFEDLNILYDKNADKLKIFDGEWEEMLLNKGIKKILQTIQSYYWDSYECFLLKKMYDPKTDVFNHQRLKELLIDYYKFIGCFDVEPYVKNKEDHEIIGSKPDNNTYSISDEYYILYVKVRDNIKKSEINNVKKAVLDIIRKNSDRNINALNKKVYELFNVDKAFKDDIVPIIMSTEGSKDLFDQL